MKFFTDLIAKSYLEYTKENDDNIAQFYFQEFYKVRPEANAKDIYSKKQFYTKLITKLDSLINKSISKERITIGTETLIQAFSATQAEIDDIYLELGHEQRDEKNERIVSKEELDYYFERPNLSFIEPLWETCDDAATLIYGIKKAKIELKDPISIINPSVDIHKKLLVLRKSKLEYLKEEAIRASQAKTIAELDSHPELSDKNIVASKESIKEENLISPEERTVKAIKDSFAQLGSKGWSYAFTYEKEFDEFVDILALMLEGKSFIIPIKHFKLKTRTRTNVSAVLKSIHDDLSNADNLKNDTPFFQLIRTLSVYEGMDDRAIYNSLTK
ncbi:hypothetical protein LCM02_15775 [Lutimonas saemankumensis]|uniref:hypothetical protein n=1 Tax=Lutimonas saemankumensis TaxID=483016 RepID=UPI001CD812CF|nr:hypothetical protein [Lutimonas saemankumensis]MCA0933921.1 hypothetical protein [Lutimonas saemankumensis]